MALRDRLDLRATVQVAEARTAVQEHDEVRARAEPAIEEAHAVRSGDVPLRHRDSPGAQQPNRRQHGERAHGRRLIEPAQELEAADALGIDAQHAPRRLARLAPVARRRVRLRQPHRAARIGRNA